VSRAEHAVHELELNPYLISFAGKLNRGISVVDTVEIIKGSKLTEEEYRKAAILGWCIELVSFELEMSTGYYFLKPC